MGSFVVWLLLVYCYCFAVVLFCFFSNLFLTFFRFLKAAFLPLMTQKRWRVSFRYYFVDLMKKLVIY